MGTFLLIFNNTLYESTDSSGTSWVQEPFPATGAPKGATALGTVGAGAWVLDGPPLPCPLWRRVDQNTFVPLNVPNTSPPVQITSDLSPNYLDFYTIPNYVPPPGGGFNIDDAVVSKDGAGRTPTFWGRYIGHPTASFNLTPTEASFLHARNCRILLIYGGTTSATVGTYQQGVNAATNAINYITNNNLVVSGC